MAKTKITDLTDYSLDPAEGLQYFSKEEAKSRLKYLGKKKKQFCVVKDEVPKWAQGDKSRKQTYSLQKKDKMKKLGIKCLR